MCVYSLGLGTNSVLLRVHTELRQYYRVPIHIKSFGTKFRYLRMHLGRIRERETERERGERERQTDRETLWQDVTPATL